MKKFELDADDSNNIRFSLENDSLNRKQELINLAKYLNAIDENYIISIDGKWGSGKSFFARQLQYVLESDCLELFNPSEKVILENLKGKYIPVYYNAWANDDHDNVVESLIFNVINQFPKFKHRLNLKDQDFRKIFEDILKNVVDKGTLGYLSKDILDNIKSVDDFANNIITYEEKKTCLNNLFNSIINGNERLLLIIDELDRCKPDYAVKVLETIKHFYSNSKITIIVSTDNRQLSSCVKKFYGYDFDGYGYLNKMYDAVISLNLSNRNNYLEKYCDFYDSGELDSQIAFFLINYYDLSLRECNRFVSMYNLCYKYIIQIDSFDKTKWMLHSRYFLPIGIVLKIKSIEQFKMYIEGKDDDFVRKITNEIIKKRPSYTDWFSKMMNVESNEVIGKILEIYHEIFNKDNLPHAYPINEALTFIGNRIQISESEK